MKLNLIPTIIAIAICSLIAYGLYCINDSGNKLLLSIGGFIIISITLIIAMGSKFINQRKGTNIKLVSGIFFLLALFSNLLFAFNSFLVSSYIIINGIILLTFITIAYTISIKK